MLSNSSGESPIIAADIEDKTDNLWKNPIRDGICQAYQGCNVIWNASNIFPEYLIRLETNNK